MENVFGPMAVRFATPLLILLIACHSKQTHALIQDQHMPQAQSTDYIPVTPDNFARAESDMYFSGVVKNGGLGKFDHTRDPAPLDKQTVMRLNQDTLYSSAVSDLDAGPVTVTLPDPGKRFMSMQVIDEDQVHPRRSLRRR